MKIKKLTREEIKEIEHKINTELVKKEKYKYYFCEGEVNEPEEAYIKDDYYIDFTIYSGFCCLGLIKLGDNKPKHSNYYEFIELIRDRLKYYKILLLWCYQENTISMRFHRVIKKKLKGQQILKNREKEEQKNKKEH